MERLHPKDRGTLEAQAGEFGTHIEDILWEKLKVAIADMPSPLIVKLATATLLADDILRWCEEEAQESPDNG